MIALRLVAVGEVPLSQDASLSVDLKMFPELPTATNIPGTDVEEELVLSFFEHYETTTTILTINTNQDKKYFILLLY